MLRSCGNGRRKSQKRRRMQRTRMQRKRKQSVARLNAFPGLYNATGKACRDGVLVANQRANKQLGGSLRRAEGSFCMVLTSQRQLAALLNVCRAANAVDRVGDRLKSLL